MTTAQILLCALIACAATGASIFIYLIWVVPEPECADIWPAESERQRRDRIPQLDPRTADGFREILSSIARDFDAIAEFAENKSAFPSRLGGGSGPRAVRAIAALHQEIDLLKFEAADVQTRAVLAPATASEPHRSA
ncbi:hypothetical protein [Cupriavidus basilensis]